MRQTAVQAQRRGGRLGRGLVLMCMLVLALCVTHQLLMASERHAMVMGPLHERVFPAPVAVSGATMPDASDPIEERRPRAPQPILGECPAQQAILPLLLMVLLLAGACLWVGRASLLPADSRAWSRSLRDFLPPPLAPARRRALLQVFLN